MWDIPALLDAFGPNYRHALREALRARGFDPPPAETIKKWRQRERIGSEWLARVLLCVPEGKDLRAFIRAPLDPDKILEI